MGQDDSSAVLDYGRFDKTRWSVVLQAVQSREPGAPQALAALCGRYWRPLYAFARRAGRSPEDAEDLVQGFFEHLFSSRGLATVDRSKGRFRSFLLASFQNFMADQSRMARAEKRGGRAQLIRLDCQDAEARLGLEPEDRVTPETLYDAHWALLLLRRATQRLQREQATMGKAETFQSLKGFLGGDTDGRVQITYEEAARTLGVSVSAVHRLMFFVYRSLVHPDRSHMALTINLTPNLNPFQPSCPLRLCGECAVRKRPRLSLRGRGCLLWRLILPLPRTAFFPGASLAVAAEPAPTTRHPMSSCVNQLDALYRREHLINLRQMQSHLYRTCTECIGHGGCFCLNVRNVFRVRQ